MLAQRFPDEFDGILAGAPGNHFSSLFLALTWSVKANMAADGSPILTPDQLPFLHQAALVTCDGRDGLEDGQIDDPRACQFDPGTLQCPDDQAQPDCLTPAQVKTVRKLYTGPADAQGQRLYPGGMPVGSELEWYILLFGWNPPVAPGLGELLARNYLSYLATWDEPVSFDDVRFDRATFEKLSQMSAIYDAIDPDLQPFRDHGGKLILWHGWNDALISPLGTVAYYQAVQDVAGDLDQAQQFARLFMFPGVAHCGTSTVHFDLLTPLMTWVEQGTAPTAVIVTQIQQGEAAEAQSADVGSGMPQPVICQAQAGRTRPVYPYPKVARYDGSGSIDDAANFVPTEPPTRYDDHVTWAGQYQSGYQQWCTWQGMEFTCQSGQPEN